MDTVQQIVGNFTKNPWIAGIVSIVAFIILLAKFTDALKKLHDFGRSVLGKPKREPSPNTNLQNQFDVLRRNIIYCGITNNIPVDLHKLRAFLIEKGLVDKPEVKRFFDKWLTNPIVVNGTPALNVFTNQAVRELQEELGGLQL